MLINDESSLYVYVVTRDLGFAPNPFNGKCTLATCKPIIRKNAELDDWIIGVAGAKMDSIKNGCIFIMKVSKKISYDQYWSDQEYENKKPKRNGSYIRMVGDNIYHKDESGNWIQEDSHHSNVDGTINFTNLQRDTGKTDMVLVSDYFLYFGAAAINLDLSKIGYSGGIGHGRYKFSECAEAFQLVQDIISENETKINTIVSDPYHYDLSYTRVNQSDGRFQK
jgi:hypothetical protein